MSNGWDKTAQTIDEGPWGLIKAIFWLSILGAILTVALAAVGVISNPFVQGTRVINKTIDADNVIYNYEWFKLRHEQILAIDRKIATANKEINNFESATGDRSTWTREDKIESMRLNSVASGLSMQRDDLAAEYNAKSRMVNRSIFKAGDIELPSRM